MLLFFNKNDTGSLPGGPVTAEADAGCAFQLLPPPPPFPCVPTREIFSLDPGDALFCVAPPFRGLQALGLLLGLLRGSGMPHFAAALSAVFLWRTESKPAGL